MKDWNKEAITLYKQSRSDKVVYEALKDKYKVTYSQVHSFLWRLRKKNQLAAVEPTKTEPKRAEPKMKHSFSYHAGIGTYEDIQIVIDGREITPEIIMEAHKLKPSEWEVVSFCSNCWQQQTAGAKIIDLCQSKLSVKPKKQIEITFEDVEEYFKTVNFQTKKAMKPFDYNSLGEVLEIDYVDAHNGLLSWRDETGNDYDLRIAEERFKECIADIFQRCKGRKFEKTIFATLGDILHVDNDNQTTTNGTFQQTEGRTPKLFDITANMLVDTVDCALKTKTPFEYVYLPGNHDRVTGYMLAKAVSFAFRKNPNVTFDITPKPQKAKVVGVNLIGLLHGDMPKKNIDGWLLKDYRKEFGDSRFVEIHSGHDHDYAVKRTSSGILHKTLPPICESSYWENQQGYRSDRGLMCFIWNKETGLRETWYYYI